MLSHRAAGSAWDILRSGSGVFDVTVGRGGRARRTGLRIHTAMALPPDEVTRLDGLPITTPARTLLDLAAVEIRNLDTALDRGAVDAWSELERLVHKLCSEHGLPPPQVNCSIEGRVRDFFWPECRLVVEADSYTWHRSPSALNADRERDVELTLAGYRVLRFTYEQVTERPDYVVGAMLKALRTT